MVFYMTIHLCSASQLSVHLAQNSRSPEAAKIKLLISRMGSTLASTLCPRFLLIKYSEIQSLYLSLRCPNFSSRCRLHMFLLCLFSALLAATLPHLHYTILVPHSVSSPAPFPHLQDSVGAGEGEHHNISSWWVPTLKTHR